MLDHGNLLTFSRYREVVNSKNYKEASNNLYRCGSKTMAAINEIMKKTVCSMKDCENKTAVRYLQWRLNINIDGVFGNETFEKVKEYQIKSKLVSDGVAGKNTWDVLLS